MAGVARLASVLAVLLLTTGEAVASKSCPTRAEAKAMFKGAYLYWYKNADGQRCWSNRRTRSESARGRQRHSERVLPKVLPPPTPALPLRLYLPAELMPPVFRSPDADNKPNILDTARWAWVHDARAAAHGRDIPDPEIEPFGELYSTFQNGTPDVWPKLPQPAEPATAGKLMLFVTTVLMGFLASLMFWRWQINRLRFTKWRWQ